MVRHLMMRLAAYVLVVKVQAACGCDLFEAGVFAQDASWADMQVRYVTGALLMLVCSSTLEHVHAALLGCLDLW